jgi:hypothetical protein
MEAILSGSRLIAWPHYKESLRKRELNRPLQIVRAMTMGLKALQSIHNIPFTLDFYLQLAPWSQ